MTRSIIAATLCIIVVLPLTAASAPPVKSISQSDCEARAGHLMHVIEAWKASGHTVTYDASGFQESLGLGTDENANKLRIGQYVNLEDGMTSLPPLRTGHEVAFYNRVKDFILHHPQGQTLGMDRLLQMGLEAQAEGSGRANLQATFLTIHNVIRILARPDKWTGDFPPPSHRPTDRYGHPPNDPAFPIFQDLLGSGSTGGDSLAKGMNIRVRPQTQPGTPRNPAGEVMRPNWSMGLFDPNGGVFQPQPGTPNAEWNAGGHYYFWIGALARTTLGTAAVVKGITGEGSAKSETGAKEQGTWELSQFTCGAMFGSTVIKNRAAYQPLQSATMDPRTAGVAGSWEGEFGCVVLSQVGANLFGDITYRNGNHGRFEGTLDGTTYNFRWSNPAENGTGSMSLIGTGFQKMSGTYSDARTHGGGPIAFTRRTAACPGTAKKIVDCADACYTRCLQFGTSSIGVSKHDPESCRAACAEYRGIATEEAGLMTTNRCFDLLEAKKKKP